MLEQERGNKNLGKYEETLQCEGEENLNENWTLVIEKKSFCKTKGARAEEMGAESSGNAASG